jgi:hypothetical protein
MEPEQRERPPRPAKGEAEGKDQSFSAACLRYLKSRGRRPG